jgi:FkbM family methyltransferase
LSDFVFDLLRADRLTNVVDIGANPIDGVPPYRTLLERRLCRVVGFEPQPAALANLNSQKSDLESHLPYVVGDGKEATLHVYQWSGLTSLLTLDQNVLQYFRGSDDACRVIKEIPVSTRRLDDISEAVDIDFLKIDVQGSELSILRNGRQRLRSAVAVQTEVSFVTLYQNQPAFGEIDMELRGLGFVPHSFVEIKRWPITSNTPHNQLLEADVVYVRNFTRPDAMSEDQLKHLALVAHHCYRSFDLAASCIRHLVNRGAIPGTSIQQYQQHLSGDQNAIAAVREKEAVAVLSRNQVCSCGSGKKYKHCCGAHR